MHRCTVSCLFEADSKLPELCKSSVEAPSVTSSKSTRCRITRSGSMVVTELEDGACPLAPGDTTSIVEKSVSVDYLRLLRDKNYWTTASSC